MESSAAKYEFIDKSLAAKYAGIDKSSAAKYAGIDTKLQLPPTRQLWSHQSAEKNAGTDIKLPTWPGNRITHRPRSRHPKRPPKMTPYTVDAVRAVIGPGSKIIGRPSFSSLWYLRKHSVSGLKKLKNADRTSTL